MGFLSDVDQAAEVATTTGVDLKLDVKAAGALPTVAAWCQSARVDPARIALWCRSPREIGQLDRPTGLAEIALLSNSSDVDAYIAAAVACGADAVSLHPGALTLPAVTSAHARGLTVYAWIRSPNGHGTAVEAGVDGLVTDWVAAARAARG